MWDCLFTHQKFHKALYNSLQSSSWTLNIRSKGGLSFFFFFFFRGYFYKIKSGALHVFIFFQVLKNGLSSCLDSFSISNVLSKLHPNVIWLSAVTYRNQLSDAKHL